MSSERPQYIEQPEQEPPMQFIDTEVLQQEAPFILTHLKRRIADLRKNDREFVLTKAGEATITDLEAMAEALEKGTLGGLEPKKIEILQALRDLFMKKHAN